VALSKNSESSFWSHARQVGVGQNVVSPPAKTCENIDHFNGGQYDGTPAAHNVKSSFMYLKYHYGQGVPAAKVFYKREATSLQFAVCKPHYYYW
jgi:hypothetical protein